MRDQTLAETVAGKGLLGTYLAYARTLTRAPLMYHLANGLGMLAGAVGSNVWWRGSGGTDTWPNLYILTLGPNGNAKTTAMKIATRLLRRAAPGSIYADEFSQERFIDGLAKHPSLVLEIEEFATLLEMTQRSYMTGLKETLTKLFDPRDEFQRHTKREGDIVVVRPSLTILGASTPDWLVAHLEEVDFKSGFMPRFMLVPQGEDQREPDVGPIVDGDAFIENSLVHQLGSVANMARTHITFEPKAIANMQRFVEDEESRAKLEGGRDELRGLISRCGPYCGKISALLCVSDNGVQADYVVTTAQAKRAATWIGWLVKAAEALFEQQIVFEKFEKAAQRLLLGIPEGGIDRSALLKRSKKSAWEFDRMLGTLVERGEIIEQWGESERGQRPRVYFRAFPNLGKNGELKGIEGGTIGESLQPETVRDGLAGKNGEARGTEGEEWGEQLPAEGLILPLETMRADETHAP